MFFTYVWRELRRRHRQALLTAMGLAVGVGLVVAVTAYASGVSKAQDQVLHSLYGVGTDISVTQTAKLSQAGPQSFAMNPGSSSKQGKAFSRSAVHSAPGQQSLAASKVSQIAALAGVKRAVGALTLTSMNVSGKFAKASRPPLRRRARSSTGSTTSGSSSSKSQGTTSQAPIAVSSFSLSGVDVSQTSIGPLSSTALVSGRTFSSSETTAHVAVLSQSYAKQNKYVVGSTIKISGTKYTVIGLVTSAAGGSSISDVYIPLQLAQTLSGNTGKVNQVYVQATDSSVISTVKSEIRSVLPKATVTTPRIWPVR